MAKHKTEHPATNGAPDIAGLTEAQAEAVARAYAAKKRKERLEKMTPEERVAAAERQRELGRTQRAKQLERMEADPEYAAQIKERQRQTYQRMAERRANDPEYAAAVKQREAARRAASKNAPPAERLAALRQQEAAIQERIRAAEAELENASTEGELVNA